MRPINIKTIRYILCHYGQKIHSIGRSYFLMGSVCHSCLFVASLFSLNAIIRLRLFQTGVIFSFNYPGSLSWVWSSRSHDKVKWPVVKVEFRFHCQGKTQMEGLYKTDTIKCRLSLALSLTPSIQLLSKTVNKTILSKGKFLNKKPPTLQLALRALGADKDNIHFITPKNLRHVSIEI